MLMLLLMRTKVMLLMLIMLMKLLTMLMMLMMLMMMKQLITLTGKVPLVSDRVTG